MPLDIYRRTGFAQCANASICTLCMSRFNGTLQSHVKCQTCFLPSALTPSALVHGEPNGANLCNWCHRVFSGTIPPAGSLPPSGAPVDRELAGWVPGPRKPPTGKSKAVEKEPQIQAQLERLEAIVQKAQAPPLRRRAPPSKPRAPPRSASHNERPSPTIHPRPELTSKASNSALKASHSTNTSITTTLRALEESLDAELLLVKRDLLASDTSLAVVALTKIGKVGKHGRSE